MKIFRPNLAEPIQFFLFVVLQTAHLDHSVPGDGSIRHRPGPGSGRRLLSLHRDLQDHPVSVCVFVCMCVSRLWLLCSCVQASFVGARPCGGHGALP